MQHPDEGTIHTWLDGELSPADAAELDAHVAECPECASAVAEARGFIAGSTRIVSALDVVPGDVIPIIQPRKRSWYYSTQFRAAAAVVFVAGASLLLFRDGKEAKMATVMNGRATDAAVAEAPAPQPLAGGESARALKVGDQAKTESGAAKVVGPQAVRESARDEQRVAANSPAPTSSAATSLHPSAPAVSQTLAQAGSVDAAKRKSSAERERRNFNEGLSQDAALAAAPPPVAAARRSAPPSAGIDAGNSKPQLDNLVVTGVAAAVTSSTPAPPPAVAPLRMMRVDTSGAMVRTRFEVSAGVEVTLTETRTADVAATTTAQQPRAVPLSKVAPSSPSAPFPFESRPTANAARVDSIKWVSAVSGRTYVLSGPLTKEQLTVLRSRLPQSTR